MRMLGAALAAALTAPPAAAQMQRGWGGYDGGWMWWMPFHGIIWLILLAAFVVGIVFLVRWLWQSGDGAPSPGGSRRRAVDVLDERYARGEIDREDYLQRRRDLTEGS